MVEDLSLLAGGDSPFDGFGPRVPRTAPAPPGFHAAGGLAILDDAGQVVGEVAGTGSNSGAPPPTLDAS